MSWRKLVSTSSRISSRQFSSSTQLSTLRQKKDALDRSRIPVLKEEDLEESFIKGGGPGGSNVNKTVSCVALKHIPTGVVVKCQFSRLLHQNREIARERLVEKLDGLLNGDMSIKAQTERLLAEKSFKASQKSQHLSELKKKYKDHLDSSANSGADVGPAPAKSIEETKESS